MILQARKKPSLSSSRPPYAPSGLGTTRLRPGVRSRFFIGYLRSGTDALVVGYENADLPLSLAEIVAPGTLTGVTANDWAVREARKRALRQGVENTRFLRSGLTMLPFHANTFHSSLAGAPLRDSRLAISTYRDQLRVLRPGGIIGTRHVAPEAVVFSRPSPVFKDLRLVKAAAEGQEAGLGVRQAPLLRQAGFINVRISTSTHHISGDDLRATFPDAEAFYDWAGPAAASADVEGAWREVVALQEEPDSFIAEVAVEAVAWKPA